MANEVDLAFATALHGANTSTSDLGATKHKTAVEESALN